MIAFIALLWGFSEATLFFIIPDVFLTYIAVNKQNKKTVITAVLLTLIGALIGGTTIYLSAIMYPEQTKQLLLNVPSVQPYMLEHVINTMNIQPYFGMISGPLNGIPYKLFAYAAPQYMTLFTFLIVSIPARMIRFIIVSIIAYYLSHHVFNTLKKQTKIIIWFLVWIIVYTIYFTIHGI